MQQINTMIIHGAYGYPEENWFGWLKRELNKLNIPCDVPTLPTPTGQTLENWFSIFNHTYLKKLNDSVILLGHSLGAVFVLRLLEQIDIKVNTVILIGAFLNKIGIKTFDDINQSFLQEPFHWDEIRKKSHQFICYHSTNDPYLSDYHSETIVNQLKAKKIIVSNAGHFNSAAGYNQFPQLLALLKQLINEI